MVLAFEQEKWELSHVKEDFSESNDLAAQNPEKLEELKQAIAEEAWKSNVYPLYDDMIMRLGAQQDRLFGDQQQFVYFASGAVRAAEESSAPM